MPSGLRSALDVALLQLVRDGDRVVGETENQLLDARESPADAAGPEEALGELRARLVHVGDDAAAEQLRDGAVAKTRKSGIVFTWITA